MIVLYPEPSFFDLEGWKRHLEWLRSEPEEIQSRVDAIEYAEFHIRVLAGTPEKTATEAA